MSTLTTPSMSKSIFRVRTVLGCVVGAATSILLAVVAVRSLPEFFDPVIAPLPEIFAEAVTEQQRSELSPKVREFLEQIESGHVTGNLASNFADVLLEADETVVDQRFKTYLFSLDGHPPKIEGHPFIFARVQSKTGRVIRCGTSSYCW